MGRLDFVWINRELNKMTEKDAYPIPRIDEMSLWSWHQDTATGIEDF